MAHYAKVENGLVVNVIVAEQDVIDSGLFGEPSSWIQTSYNTRGGVHYEPNSNTPSADQSKALRKNYASIGYTYDVQRDAFIPPKTLESWVLNEFSCNWEAPIPYPQDGKNYYWDEPTISWKEVNND
jgi:hypothetical protein